MCTHLKPCITPNFISQQNVEMMELHKLPKNNLKQISSPSTQHSTPNCNKFQSCFKPQNQLQAHCNENNLASNYNFHFPKSQ
jgi:hypothetical protein